jgi:hypothetical protein
VEAKAEAERKAREAAAAKEAAGAGAKKKGGSSKWAGRAAPSPRCAALLGGQLAAGCLHPEPGAARQPCATAPAPAAAAAGVPCLAPTLA